jgi:hypothetical protein
MISISPPQVVPYAPSTMPIALVHVHVFIDPDLPMATVNVGLMTAAGARVPIDRKQVAAFDKTMQAAFLAYVESADEPLSVAVQKAALPYLESAYGLVGTVV